METKRSQIYKQEPTPFQKEILALSWEDFYNRTNIRELIRKEAPERRAAKNLPQIIAESEIEGFAKHYYEKLYKVHRWAGSALEDIQILSTPEVEPPKKIASTTKQLTMKKTTIPKAKASKMSKTKTVRPKRSTCKSTARGANEVISYSAETAVNEETNKIIIDIVEDYSPSKFQAEIIRMTLKRFVHETNIGEIVRNDLLKMGETATDEQTQMLINKYFERRMDIDKWYSCGLKNLKYHLCECKRNVGISMRNVRIQKDIHTKEAFIQCDQDIQQPKPVFTQPMAFNEVRMSQLPERNETQDIPKNSSMDPLETMLIQCGIPAVTNTPKKVTASTAIVTPQPTQMVSSSQVQDILPMVDLIMELEGSTPEPIENVEQEKNDNERFVVLFETTTQTQNFDELNQPSVENNVNKTKNSSVDTEISASTNDNVNVKDEPIEILSITQINEKYVGDLVAEEIPKSSVTIQDSQNTEVFFEDIMENPGSDSMGDCTVSQIAIEMTTATTAEVNSVNSTQNSIVQGTQESPIKIAEPVTNIRSTQVDKIVSQVRQRPCPKSKKRFYQEVPAEMNEKLPEKTAKEVPKQTAKEVLENMAKEVPEQTANEGLEKTTTRTESATTDTISSLEIDSAMADLFKDQEPQLIVSGPTENNENINPQLAKFIALKPFVSTIQPNNNNKNLNKKREHVKNLLRRTVKQNRVQKQLTTHSNDDTLSTIQPPKYNYEPLDIMYKKNTQKQTEPVECERNFTMEMPDEEEPIIEVDDTPPCIENPRDFLIEDCSIDGDSQISQTPPNQVPSTVTILNTDNSIFLSTQLLNVDDKMSASEPPISTAPETVETRCDDSSDDVIMNDSTVDLFEKRSLDRPYIEPAPPQKRRKIIAADDTSVAITIDLLESLPDETTERANVISLTSQSHAMEQNSHTMEPNAVAVTEKTQINRPTGYEWLEMSVPNSINYTYLHYIDIENVSYRYNVDRLPSDVAYNICKQQESQCATLNLKFDGMHRIIIKGQCMKKLLKLKYMEWRAVQAVLELIKQFTYNSRTKESSASSLLERALHHLFASTSKFSNVHIQRTEYDEEQNRDVCRILNTSYTLRPKVSAKRLRSTIDPYILEKINFRAKKQKK